MATWARSHVKSYGICGGESVTVCGFSLSPSDSHSTSCSTFINHPVIDPTYSILTVFLTNKLKKEMSQFCKQNFFFAFAFCFKTSHCTSSLSVLCVLLSNNANAHHV
jgi:hypothetical protein